MKSERQSCQRLRRAGWWLSLICAITLLSCPALAHRTSTGPTTGISIPSLTHGQMSVIDKYRSDILDLANKELRDSDRTFFRLRNYINLQYFYCLWGVMPGSVTDDSSPFNECSHGYLSGVQALLLYMRTMPGDQTQVYALIDRIEIEMLRNNASMVLCQYSKEAFNTADHISPHWRDIPFHLPTLLTLLGFAICCVGAGAAAMKLLRTQNSAVTSET